MHCYRITKFTMKFGRKSWENENFKIKKRNFKKDVSDRRPPINFGFNAHTRDFRKSCVNGMTPT